LDEVLLMVKEHQGASSTRMKAQEDWKGAAKKRAEVTSDADLRCAAFTDVEVRLRLYCLDVNHTIDRYQPHYR
jgi:DnaJ family protein C protein 2